MIFLPCQDEGSDKDGQSAWRIAVCYRELLIPWLIIYMVALFLIYYVTAQPHLICITQNDHKMAEADSI